MGRNFTPGQQKREYKGILGEKYTKVAIFWGKKNPETSGGRQKHSRILKKFQFTLWHVAKINLAHSSLWMIARPPTAHKIGEKKTLVSLCQFFAQLAYAVCPFGYWTSGISPPFLKIQIWAHLVNWNLPSGMFHYLILIPNLLTRGPQLG